MKKIIISTLIIIVSLVPLPSYAMVVGIDTGNELLTACKSAISVIEGKVVGIEEQFNSAICVGYMNGIFHANQYIRSTNTKNQLFCPPSRVTPAQNIRIVVKYLENNLAILHVHASLLTIAALKEEYKCNQGK